MNAIERAKVKALRRLPIPRFSHSALLIRNLNWHLAKDPRHPLTRTQKYLLDLACWHYRNSLGGLVDFELPTTKPQRRDYLPDPKQLAQERLL